MNEPRTEYKLSAFELKRAAHEFVEARLAAAGESTYPVGYVSLELYFDPYDANRVMGCRLYYTREPDPRDDPTFALRAMGGEKVRRRAKR